MFPPGEDANTSSDGCEVEDFDGIDVSNKIVVIQRGSCDYVTKAQNAEDKGAVGVLIFNEGQENRTGAVDGTLQEFSEVTVPAIGISFDLGKGLYDLSQAGSVAIHMTVVSSDETRTSNNLLAETPGGNGDQVVMLGAHLDSVATAPGTNDNGSGSAAVLEFAVQMAQKGFNPVNKVRFGWWTVEEEGTVGSFEYLNSLSDEDLSKIGMYLNFDMIASHNYAIFVYDGNVSDTADEPTIDEDMAELVRRPESGAIEQVFVDYFDSVGLIAYPDTLDARSDYDNFVYAGIPIGGANAGGDGTKTEEQATVYGGTAGETYDECYHKLCDNMENLNMDAMTSISKGLAHVAQHYAQKTKLFDDTPARRRASRVEQEKVYRRNHSEQPLSVK
jgi:Zn-dependent M28 family amino/carboxypeptidase